MSTAPAGPPCHPPKSRWGWLHWSLCLAPFAFLVAIPIFGLAQYAWVPLAAALACPAGMGLMMWQMNRSGGAHG